MTKCLTPNCHYPQAPALGRGLCMRCYSKAKESVDAGSVTWDELVGLGMALSKEDGGLDPFTIELNKRLEGNSANGQ